MHLLNRNVYLFLSVTVPTEYSIPSIYCLHIRVPGVAWLYLHFISTIFFQNPIIMKSLRFSLVALLAFLGSAAFAQSKTDSIKVAGNCGMCKKRIEAAVKVDGVSTAAWDAKTKMLTINYDASKIKLEDVERKVADVGHDTPKFKATEAVYSKLPGCCKYDRDAAPGKKPAPAHNH